LKLEDEAMLGLITMARLDLEQLIDPVQVNVPPWTTSAPFSQKR